MSLVVFSYANPFADQLQLEERIFIDGHLSRIEQVQCVLCVQSGCGRFFGEYWRNISSSVCKVQ